MKKSHHVFAEVSHFKSIYVFPLLSFSEDCEHGMRDTLNFQGFGELAHQEPQKSHPKLLWDERVPVMD